MAFAIIGNGGVIAEVDGTAFRGLRTTPRPTDHGALGHYSYGGFSGIIPAALAANSEIFQFRWTDPTRFSLIRRVRFHAAVSTTFFSAGVPVQIDLVKATAWSAAGTGGTRVTPAANMKMRTSMGGSLVAAGDIAIATTAALGAGTKTLESNSLAAIMAAGPITASLNGQIFPTDTILYDAPIGDGQHPLILAQNEGFVVRSVNVPATGTWQFSISVDYGELTGF